MGHTWGCFLQILQLFPVLFWVILDLGLLGILCCHPSLALEPLSFGEKTVCVAHGWWAISIWWPRGRSLG